MRHLRLFLILMLIWASNHCTHLHAYEQIEYIARTGRSTSMITWEMDGGLDIVIRVRQGKESFVNYCDRSGATHRWTYRSTDTDIHVERQKNVLRMTGTHAGKDLKRDFRLDDAPWFQPLSYSLSEFLSSDQSMVVFWIVRSDNMKAVKLKAEKERIENIRIGDDLIETQQIRVSPVGFYSWVWSGFYWYRVSDNLFVRYRGGSGIPGKPETIIELRASGIWKD